MTWIIRRPPARANLSRSCRDSHDCSGHVSLGLVGNIKSFPKSGQKLYGENWREDVKIGGFLDNIGSQRARIPLAGFLGSN